MKEEPGEEFEFVPWSELRAHARAERPWAVYLLAAAVAAAVLGALLARGLWRPQATPPTPEPTVAAAPPPPTAPTAPPAPVVPTTAPPATAPVSGLYSEADLLATLPEAELATAELRAEWFVTDFFTVDGSQGSEAVREALPEGAALPDLPHDGGGPASYVEWARALETVGLEEGLYRVRVVFRVLSVGEESIRRLPVRAVDVVVGVAPDGGSAVVDLPAPAPLPDSPEPVAWPEEGEPAPPGILEAAAEEAARWGDQVRVVSSTRGERGWRVVVEAADPAEGRWPLVLWLDEAGPLDSPPWLAGHP